MRFSYLFLYVFFGFFCSMNPAFCAGEEQLSDEELLNKHSKLFSLPLFPIKEFIEENRSSFNDDKLKAATEPKAVMELSELDKQQLCWQCLLYMKDLYRDNEETGSYAYAYLNMAKFLLNTGIYPDKVFQRKRSNNKPKLFHSRLITKIAKIVKRSERKEKDKIYKWSRIYMALLSMDYADKYEREQKSKEEHITQAYKRLLEANRVKSTKTVNFYLAKLILDPKFRYIPPCLDRQGANMLARQYLSAMLERGKRQPSRGPDVRSDDRQEKPPLYPIKSAQPAYLHRGSTRLSVQESSNEERGSTELDVDMVLFPSIPSVSLDSSRDQDDAEHRIAPFSSAGSRMMDLTIEDHSLHQERKQNKSEYSAAPSLNITLASSDSSISLSSTSASRSSGVKDELKDKEQDDSDSSDEDQDRSQQGMESKVSASKSLLTPSREILGGSGPLKKALEEATKAKKVTGTLKQELKNKYPNPKNPTAKDLEVIRLVLCIKECEGLSQKKIVDHILLKGKLSQSLVSSILKENGVKSVVGFTEQRKQELLVPYVAIKARAEKDARLRLRDIARAIAQGLGHAEKEIIWQLEALMNDRSQQDTPNEHQKKTVCKLYNDGKTYPEIKEKTKLSFVAITQIILEKIPSEELKSSSTITLLKEADLNRQYKAIVACFKRLKQEEGVDPTAVRVSNETEYGLKACLRVLKQEGLIEDRPKSKHLDESTKKKIKKFWEEQKPQWDKEGKKGRSLARRLKETASKFEISIHQVRTVCVPNSKRKKRKQDEDSASASEGVAFSKKVFKSKKRTLQGKSTSGLKDKRTFIKGISKRQKT